VIVPITYNALHFYSASIFIVNEGGSPIIRWFDGDDKESKWSVVGGVFRAIDKEGNTLAEVDSEEGQFNFHTTLQALQPWDDSYAGQTIGAYFYKRL
jgi:hypothetical protein